MSLTAEFQKGHNGDRTYQLNPHVIRGSNFECQLTEKKDPALQLASIPPRPTEAAKPLLGYSSTITSTSIE
jgi:hypothetical protein